MKKSTIIILMILIGIIAIAVPFIINESYKANTGYITLWGANESLSYFSSILSVIGTFVIGFIAISQSDKANDINDRLLKLQEIVSAPFFHLDDNASCLQSFGEKTFDILIYFKNETNSVINIVEVSDLEIEGFVNNGFKVPFCKGWTTHYSVLPHQSKDINFMIDRGKGEEPFIRMEKFFFNDVFAQVKCNLDIKIQSVNSTDIYTKTRILFADL